MVYGSCLTSFLEVSAVEVDIMIDHEIESGLLTLAAFSLSLMKSWEEKQNMKKHNSNLQEGMQLHV